MNPFALFDEVGGTLVRYTRAGQRIVVGLSGGMDSVVLLTLLDELRPSLHFHLVAHHVNHQISPNSHEWQTFCANLCLARGIPFGATVVTVPRDSGKGLEAAARAARHVAFAKVDCDFIALAHHQDDQAETLLLRLLRGAGVKGLGAMAEEGPLQANQSGDGAPLPRLLRPLLHVPRSSLLLYAQARRLMWIDDESNKDESYARNYLRAEVLPRVAARFPAYRSALDRAASQFAHSAQLLDALAAVDAAGAFAEDRLAVAPLAALEPARAANVLRYWLAQNRLKMPDADHLNEILRQVTDAGAGAGVCIGHDGIQLRRFRGWLHIVHPRVAPTRDLHLPWPGRMHWNIAELGGVLVFSEAVGVGLARSQLQAGRVAVRLRSGGEQLRLAANRPEQTLKNLFQAARIPPWERDCLPLLFIDERLASVPGIGVDALFQAEPGMPSVLVNWMGKP
jgi:tRNA(Ile)-lysidine synthase